MKTAAKAKKRARGGRYGLKDMSSGAIHYITGPIGPWLKTLRIGLDYTLEQAAEVCDVCVATIQRREQDTDPKGTGGMVRTLRKMLKGYNHALIAGRDM